MFRWMVVGFAFALTGCAANLSHESSQVVTAVPLDSFSTQIEYIDASYQSISSERGSRELLVLFPAVQGGIFGNPGTDLLAKFEGSDEMRFDLPLSSLQLQADALATPLSERWMEAGLQVTPSKARILRVGTFAMNRYTRTMMKAASFVGEKSRTDYILVYFDRACRISGTISGQGQQFVHEIHVSKPGFYFLKNERVSEGKFLMQATTISESVRFAVHL